MSESGTGPLSDANSIVLFDQATMSGITPGVRTRTFQRVRLNNRSDGATHWARLLWHPVSERPVADEEVDDGRIDGIDGAVCTLHLQDSEGDSWSVEPLLSLSNVRAEGLLAALVSALSDVGWGLRTCGTCRWWQPGSVTQVDGLPAGYCRFAPGSAKNVEIPEQLAVQSMLALDCGAWTEATGDRGSASEPWRSDLSGNVASSGAPPALPKAAESKATGGFLSRLGALFGRYNASALEPQTWQEQLVERSGVGAGAEPCFGCQGRIANLGALTVETREGDKQTYSVWRCRSCYGAYLNSWIDRWERLDSLETDERIYRVAPAEACEFLAVIDGVAGGDHPTGREFRGEQRAWFEARIVNLDPLSHQVKHGR